jgi:hypothetical protein
LPTGKKSPGFTEGALLQKQPTINDIPSRLKEIRIDRFEEKHTGWSKKKFMMLSRGKVFEKFKNIF